MLNQYLSETQQLLSNPSAPSALYAPSDLTDYINTARLQLAGESECVRVQATLAVVAGNISYNFSSIFVPNAVLIGIQGVYNLRQVGYASGTKTIYMGPRSYPWATFYWLQNGSSVVGPPTEWAQYAPGQTGSLVINPAPDTNYTLNIDATGVPIDLGSDTDPEAIPYPYQDAVPFFAAYYAYMSTQRQADADRMYTRYKEFLGRAKTISVPMVGSPQFDQYAPPAVPTPVSGGGGA